MRMKKIYKVTAFAAGIGLGYWAAKLRRRKIFIEVRNRR